MMVMSCSDLFAWAGNGTAHHQTGGQDSDEHLLAQALLRSLRRRGVTPHRVFSEDRQIRGKTTRWRSEGESGTPENARLRHSRASIAVRIRTPENTSTNSLTIRVARPQEPEHHAADLCARP